MSITDHNMFLFLVQLLLLLGLARLLGEVFRRWKQPTLTAELLVGIILGPTVLGHFFPDYYAALFPADPTQWHMLQTIAWVGVLFLLLDAGMEMDFSVAWRQGGNALIIAVWHICVPMVIAFVTCWFLPDSYLMPEHSRLLFAFFMATVLTISALPVAARALQDCKLLKTEVGFLVMTALVINDIVGWAIFAVILAVATQGQGQFSLQFAAVVIIAPLVFGALALTLGRRASTHIISSLQRAGLPEPSASITFACLTGLLFGAITQKIGIHALFGFFVAGIVVGEAKSLSEETRTVISQMVAAIFVPIFFASVGLRIDFIASFDWKLAAFVTVMGIGGRYLGAWWGVNYTGLSRLNRDVIAIAHTPGGMMEIVVAMLALDLRLITPTVFVAIVFGAVFSSIIVGPWLRRAMQRGERITAVDFLSRDGVVADLEAAGQDEAIRQLCERLWPRLGMATMEKVREAIIEREHDLGTAIGEEVAIPHARTGLLQDPVLVFARAPAGVPWNAPDGQPVRFVFLLLTPHSLDTLQVKLLASIARCMMSPETRQALSEAPNEEALWRVLRQNLQNTSNN